MLLLTSRTKGYSGRKVIEILPIQGATLPISLRETRCSQQWISEGFQCRLKSSRTSDRANTSQPRYGNCTKVLVATPTIQSSYRKEDTLCPQASVIYLPPLPLRWSCQRLLRAGDQPLGGKQLTSIQEAIRDLTREVEFLQDIVAESGEKKQILYNQADAMLSDIADFQISLKSVKSRQDLYKAFDELDTKLHNFLKAVKAIGPERLLLQRATIRVIAADEELHYAVSAHDPSQGRAKLVLDRQANALLTAARQLDAMASFTFGATPGRAILVGDLRKLAEVTERFQQRLASGANRPELRKNFAAVNQAWERATRGLAELKAGEQFRLIGTAAHLDRIHERLYRLLDIKGDRPQLILRT